MSFRCKHAPNVSSSELHLRVPCDANFPSLAAPFMTPILLFSLFFKKVNRMVSLSKGTPPRESPQHPSSVIYLRLFPRGGVGHTAPRSKRHETTPTWYRRQCARGGPMGGRHPYRYHRRRHASINVAAFASPILQSAGQIARHQRIKWVTGGGSPRTAASSIQRVVPRLKQSLSHCDTHTLRCGVIRASSLHPQRQHKEDCRVIVFASSLPLFHRLCPL